MTYLFLMIAIVAEVIATTALKASESFTRPVHSIIVVLGYGCAFYCLSLVLHQMSVGAAYAIWAGLGVALISLLGLVFYNEKPDLAAIFGITLIIAGVVVLNLFSDTVMH